MLDKNIILTSDGSHTLLNTNGASYHSVHGAIAESRHVFINAGLSFLKKRGQIKLLEIGFGSGLNALLSYQFSGAKHIIINYHSIEPNPIPENIFTHLNYGSLLNESEIFLKLHKILWNRTHILSSNFSFKKHLLKFENFSGEENFDVIFFDAFAPNEQPELWTEFIYDKLYYLLNKDGVLVTYCSKGIVKRGLKKAGFVLQTLPGPPKKREMLRAIKA